jgi:hypothetical protein
MAARRLSASLLLIDDIQLHPAGDPLPWVKRLAGGLELEPQPVPALGQCILRAHLSSSGRQDLGLLALELPG